MAIRFSRLARTVLLGAFAVPLLAISSTPLAALRHLRLLKSSPVADTVLASSPDAIRLWLSEPSEAPGSRIALATTDGAAIALQAITRDAAKDAPLVARLVKPLAVGSYTVTWKAMSKDGHVVNGTFGFKVGAAR